MTWEKLTMKFSPKFGARKTGGLNLAKKYPGTHNDTHDLWVL